MVGHTHTHAHTRKEREKSNCVVRDVSGISLHALFCCLFEHPCLKKVCPLLSMFLFCIFRVVIKGPFVCVLRGTQPTSLPVCFHIRLLIYLRL